MGLPQQRLHTCKHAKKLDTKVEKNWRLISYFWKLIGINFLKIVSSTYKGGIWHHFHCFGEEHHVYGKFQPIWWKQCLEVFFSSLMWGAHNKGATHLWFIFVLVIITIPTHEWLSVMPLTNSKHIWIFVVIFIGNYNKWRVVLRG